MIRFTRGNRFYQIAPAYAGGEGYVGLCDGRVVARALDRAAVALALITGGAARMSGAKAMAPDLAQVG